MVVVVLEGGILGKAGIFSVSTVCNIECVVQVLSDCLYIQC